MKIDLREKVILITGSSRGIGYQLAKSFSKEGAYIVLNYHKSLDSALKLYQRISKYTECMMIEADISNSKQAHNLIEEAINHYGRVDVLINNAGINCDSEVLTMEDWQWNSVIQTNLTGTFYCARSFLHHMSQQRRGKIINIGSLMGVRGRETQTNYSASKAALVGLTRSLAKEAAKYNIAVNLVCPGFIATDLNKNNPRKRQLAQGQSVFPITTSYDDLKNTLMLLISDSIKGVTGQIFYLDSRI